MSNRRKDIAELDKYYLPCGPCAFCGHSDKRHRLWDMFIDSPESDESLAADYREEIEHIRAVRRIRPYR